MARASHREKLLAAGLEVIHERGLSGASVRDIAAAANVPLGSFTNHFRSKEAFGLAVLERYFQLMDAQVKSTLLDKRREPLARLRAYIDSLIKLLDAGWNRKGCLLGNFSAEITDADAELRRRVLDMFEHIEGAIATCLREAVQRGDLPKGTDVGELARFINSSQQGATLFCKARRSAEPMRRFKKVLFGTVLKA